MFDKKILANIESKMIVFNDPFPNIIIENFLSSEIVRKAEHEFIKFSKTVDAGNKIFQKTKKQLENYESMPLTIKGIIDFLLMSFLTSFLIFSIPFLSKPLSSGIGFPSIS